MSSRDFNPSDRPRRHPDSAYRVVGDEGGLVVLPGKAEVKVLNPVAVKVFGLLDGNRSVAQIVQEVTEEFEVDERRAFDDVGDFLRELAEHGMLAEASAVPGESTS